MKKSLIRLAASVVLSVALVAAIMTNPAVQRRDIEIFLSSLGPGKTARYIEEEMTWRLEY